MQNWFWGILYNNDYDDDDDDYNSNDDDDDDDYNNNNDDDDDDYNSNEDDDDPDYNNDDDDDQEEGNLRMNWSCMSPPQPTQVLHQSPDKIQL